MAINLATKYSDKVDEKFVRESQVAPAVNNEYNFTGVKTVVVYSFETVDLKNYTRTGNNRYGTPTEMQDTTQTLEVTQDRAFTFTIDRGNKIQRLMLEDAGKALARQIREKVVPEYDSYCYKKMIDNAGKTETGTLTKDTAFAALLAGQEYMGNKSVPDTGRIAFCSYGFYNLLLESGGFVKDSDTAQRGLISGELAAKVDGIRLIRVPSTRFPSGSNVNFILMHPSMVIAPRQLTDYKIHDNPPGINGWLVEGRLIYDCFVLNNKKDAIYVHTKSGTP